ncbi:CvpA family protein [Stieleria varia]|uniref:Colicin V production protein n=1 Tax=Stieleria varia TaxID=2528005 RepID=A0A5C5ZWC4_9BACT|nr:CvpA family protein [Stieleria varia]TWT91291.1 Colicin V production protein [Stieleria varia]
MSNFSAIERYSEAELDNDRPEPEPIRMPPKLRWALVIGALGGFACFAYQRDFVTATFIAVTGLSALSGFRVGVARLFSCVLGFALAYRFAPGLGTTYEYQFSRVLETSGLTNRFLSIAVIGIVISALVCFLSHKIITRFMERRRNWAVADRYVGCITGLGQAAFATLLLLGGILYLEPMMPTQADGVEPNAANRWVVNLADNTRTSKVGPIVKQYNPFEYFDVLRQVGTTQKAVRVLSDPQNLRRMIDDPSIRQLQEEPEFQLAMQNLLADPEIKEILQSGQPIDRATALRLMSNPAIKDMVDQKDFMKRAKQLLMNQIESMDRNRPAA